MSEGGSALYPGRVMHRRLRPRAHALQARIVSLLLDIDELEALDRRLKWFSLGRFNLFSFRPGDLGDGSGDLRGFAVRMTAAMDFAVGRVRLLTMPRVLGMAFNPLTTWFVEDSAGALRAIIYEVNNTFGERHHYALPVAPGAASSIRQSCTKAFHVSPFMAMDLAYAFRVTPPGERLSVAITVSDGAGPMLCAVHSGERRALTDAALLGAFLAHPMQALRVTGGIGWNALRLWFKRVPLYAHPRKALR